MPNGYAVTICGFADYEKFSIDAFNTTHAETNLCEQVRPMPPELKEGTDGDPACDWARENWGTKWGAFDVKAHPIIGDQNPCLITFQCAWCPPSPRVLTLIIAWLMLEIGLESPTVVGFEPYDCSTEILYRPATEEESPT